MGFVLLGLRRLRGPQPGKRYMKTNRRKLTPEFGPETRFDMPPPLPAPFRAMLNDELERLKDRLLREALAGAEPALVAPLRRAANEAAALAWVQPFALLLLPELFAEKARTAAKRTRRQREILSQTRGNYAKAA